MPSTKADEISQELRRLGQSLKQSEASASDKFVKTQSTNSRARGVHAQWRAVKLFKFEAKTRFTLKKNDNPFNFFAKTSTQSWRLFAYLWCKWRSSSFFSVYQVSYKSAHRNSEDTKYHTQSDNALLTGIVCLRNFRWGQFFHTETNKEVVMIND